MLQRIGFFFATWMEDNQGITLTKKGVVNRLLSYYFIASSKRENGLRRYLTTGILNPCEENIKTFPIISFIDSGAFSALTKGAEINLKDFQYLLGKYPMIDRYANLDVIGNPEATYNNQKQMEKDGFHPIPCYHQGEEEEHFLRYLNEGYDYIALGGMVGTRTEHLIPWLDRCFDLINDPNGIPRVKIHGFGLTSLRLLKRYPWYSVDSTSWVRTSRMGMLLVPKKNDITGEYDYLEPPMKVGISKQSSTLKIPNSNYFKLDNNDPVKIKTDDYLNHINVPVGKSEYSLEKADERELEDNEVIMSTVPNFFFDEEYCKLIKGIKNVSHLKKIVNDKKYVIVEKIVEKGAGNDYVSRDEASIDYNNGVVADLDFFRHNLKGGMSVPKEGMRFISK